MSIRTTKKAWRWVCCAAIVGLASCATAAKLTIEDRLNAIGLSASQAACMADELDTRLSTEDLRDLAQYTVTLTRADTPRGALDALLRIDNPRAIAAIGQSGFACVLSSISGR